MTTYRLNGAPVVVISQRSENRRRYWKIQFRDGTIQEVPYRALERERESASEIVGQKFTPKQWKRIRKGAASVRMKRFWMRQNKAQAH
jgi:hypothetical protein